jgi:hypothetical protein
MNACRVFVGNPEGNRSLARTIHRSEDYINMHFRDIVWGNMDWTYLALDRDQWRALVNTIMNLWDP